MRIWLHIGPAEVGARRLQEVLAIKRERLRRMGVLVPGTGGTAEASWLCHAAKEEDPERAASEAVSAELAREVETHRPEALILSCASLGASLHRRAELDRLKAMLTPLSQDIRILAHVDDPARLLARAYAAQVMAGRTVPLERDLALAAQPDWWRACLEAGADTPSPADGAPFWLDFTALTAFWEGAFGPGSVTLRPYDAKTFATPAIANEIRATFELPGGLGKVPKGAPTAPPSAAWLARARQLNLLLAREAAHRHAPIPASLRRAFLDEIAIGGAPIAPGALAVVSRRFAAANAALIAAHPALTEATFAPDPSLPDWTEPDPERGFRASQYLLAFQHRIDRAQRAARRAERAEPSPAPAAAPPPASDACDTLGPAARRLMPPRAVQNYEMLKTSRFHPHNRLGSVREDEAAAPYPPVPPTEPPEGSTGKVIVGCMKDEAPYILEWIAHHRAIGVDHFLIYTNDCSDGTAQMLDRLQEMGLVQHRRNDDWKGKSPQQHALNRARREPVIRDAAWILHIDVDEFINVRTGAGTLDDFLARVPQATHVAMTWRLFGHNDVTRLADELVVEQFDTCAPSFCPKPHTVWGFKTMFRNIGAYAKISCHRPNQLREGFRDKVTWVNGSGQDMTREAALRGWRNSLRSIGYDLLQLNHYALRSAESFLIKRQRGRALHVDRAIGLNYWIRMDWSDARDLTIKRNIPRLRAERDRLLADETLARWHRHGLDWHRAKADALHADPEFAALYRQALDVKLSAPERVAFSLALDMDS
ncbi:MAG: glycosyltransferase family 2 protein [Sedimentitalea sp.]|nr:glycosyltransferase family 2 protein [Sedimentitalea sp.]